MAYRTHRAREYGVGEYEEKEDKVRKYLKFRSSYELGFTGDDTEEFLSDIELDQIIKFYLIFILSCKIQEGLLYSKMGPLLRKDFNWKEQDFSWAKDAINLIDPELINHFKETMMI